MPFYGDRAFVCFKVHRIKGKKSHGETRSCFSAIAPLLSTGSDGDRGAAAVGGRRLSQFTRLSRPTGKRQVRAPTRSRQRASYDLGLSHLQRECFPGRNGDGSRSSWIPESQPQVQAIAGPRAHPGSCAPRQRSAPSLPRCTLPCPLLVPLHTWGRCQGVQSRRDWAPPSVRENSAPSKARAMEVRLYLRSRTRTSDPSSPPALPCEKGSLRKDPAFQGPHRSTHGGPGASPRPWRAHNL